MKKVSLKLRVVLGCLLMLPAMVWSQCENLNFNYGNLTGWQCYMGGCASQNYWIQPTAQIPGKIDIMNAEELKRQGRFQDEVCAVIPKVPEGFNFSCKIGNSVTGAEVDGIEYELTVDSMSSLLVLSFAWVMQNPGHSLPEQPKFTMSIKDSLGRLLQIPCNPVIFSAGFVQLQLACDNTNGQAMSWTTVGYSLESLIGSKIKIYFEVWDCTQSGHYGYSYVVAECRPMRIDLQYCDGTKIARMIAPEGFSGYEWERTSIPSWRAYTKQINIQEPLDGETFTVTVASVLGPACSSQLKTVIAKTKVDANFMFGVKGDFGTLPEDVCFPCNNYQNWYDTCSRTATFVDFTQVHNSKKQSITWEIDGLPVASHDSMFTYTFPDPGDLGKGPTTYLVRLRGVAENGCADTSMPAGHYITIYPSAKIKIDGPTQMCEGNTEILAATAIRSEFVEHRWSWRNTNGTPIINGDTLLIDYPGTYYLQSLDTNKCWAYDTLVVTSLKPKIEDLKITPVDCWGNATGEFEHRNITGGAFPFQSATWTYWDDVKKEFKDSSIINRIGQTIVFRNQIAGVYVFNGIDAENCPISDTIIIPQPDSLRLFPTPTKTKCLKPNGQIAFEVTGGIMPYNISIYGPAENDPKNIAPTNRSRDSIFNLPEGTYIAKVIDSNNCVTGGILVEVLAYPYPTIIVDTIVTAKCEEDNGAIKLKAYYITETDTTDSPIPSMYTWTNSEGDPVEVNMLAPGTYRLEFVDGFNCPIDTSFTVGAFPSPIISYDTLPEICGRQNGEITVTVKSSSPDFITYEWYDVTNNSAMPDTTNIITDLKAGTYAIHVIDSFCEAWDTIVIPHIDGPRAEFAANTYSVPTNTIFKLTADTMRTKDKIPQQSWFWNMGDGNTMQGMVIRYSYEETGDYIVLMEVTDANGCTDTISKIIHVYDELHVYIPNAFSPNIDGLNETWRPIVLENDKEGYMLTVYDRWGQRVFHTTDPNEAWDGNINGKPAQNNTVYSYRLIVRDFTGQEFEYVGHVSIIR